MILEEAQVLEYPSKNLARARGSIFCAPTTKTFRTRKLLAAARSLVYSLGFVRLLYWHTSQTYKSFVHKEPAEWASQCQMRKKSRDAIYKEVDVLDDVLQIHRDSQQLKPSELQFAKSQSLMLAMETSTDTHTDHVVGLSLKKARQSSDAKLA